MSFDVDLRITRARRRIHKGIDIRCAMDRIELEAQSRANKEWLAERGRFYARSIGQINRHQRKGKQ